MSCNSLWQFTVRGLAGFIGASGAFLAISRWQNPILASGYCAVGSIVFLGIAACLRRKRWGYTAGTYFVAFAVALVLFRFGPASHEESVCRICGKNRDTETYLGLTWYSRETESDLSRWYRAMDLGPHVHQWGFCWDVRQSWGGRRTNGDSFGFWTQHLSRLRDISHQVAPATFKELAAKYRTVCEESTDLDEFFRRCDEILPVDEATNSDPP